MILNKMFEVGKRWVETPPKRNFWFYVAMCVILSKLLAKMSLGVVFIQLGLLTPETSVDALHGTVEKVSNQTTVVLMDGFEQLVYVGRGLAVRNSEMAFWIAQTLGYMQVSIFLLTAAFLFNGILRWLIHTAYKWYLDKNEVEVRGA